MGPRRPVPVGPTAGSPVAALRPSRDLMRSRCHPRLATRDPAVGAGSWVFFTASQGNSAIARRRSEPDGSVARDMSKTRALVVAAVFAAASGLFVGRFALVDAAAGKPTLV